MLEDFDNLDNDLQTYLLSVCSSCNGCRSCTKGGKNRVHTVKVTYNGKEYALCPDTYSRNNWETIRLDTAKVLFKYHDMQEVYGSNWKKK